MDADNFPKSLTDQIVDELLALLAEKEAFDSKTIENLSKLGVSGLTEASVVLKAIDPDEKS